MRRNAILLAILLVGLGCSANDWPDGLRRVPGPDDAVGLIPWFSTMHYGLAIQPYKWPVPRPPVEGTVPVTGAEVPLPITPANLPAINAVPNPVERTATSLETGKARYEVYCQPCHGPGGAGDGLVNEKLLVTPSLLTDQAKRYTDGYLHAIVRHGRGIMPAYGDRVPGTDRWDVVNYVRVLQGRTP
ncbi:MAG: cytochrome c [Gemmatimonadota bacterium]|nr:cytochrome c [Gemmatimonadota bacterium]MDH4351210.1 cytochrome c [Gemmatimonadota bacterium]MDH5197570.1 cytochrome c [Gemmatimonadota bacterium]